MQRRKLVAALLVHLALAAAYAARGGSTAPDGGDNWAVIVGASRFWLNYRHTANTMAVYRAVRRLGIPDSRIILMLADPAACNPRNGRPGEVATSVPEAGGAAGAAAAAGGGLYAPDLQVDYRGRDVSVDSILRLLTGQHPPGTPPGRRLLSGPRSNVLLYLTGHGGDQFLKLHDSEELLAADLAAGLAAMHAAGRYKEVLLMLDTCQASTMYSLIDVPGVIGIGSSTLGKSSYALTYDKGLGVHLADEFTHALERFLLALPPAGASASLQELLDFASAQRLSSALDARLDLVNRTLAEIRVMEFFGGSGEVGAEGSREEQRGSGGSGRDGAEACRPRRAAEGMTVGEVLLGAGGRGPCS